MKFTIIFLLTVFSAGPAARAQSTTYGCILDVRRLDPATTMSGGGIAPSRFVQIPTSDTNPIRAHAYVEAEARKKAKECTEQGSKLGKKSYICFFARCFNCAISSGVIAGILNGQRKACAGQ